MRQDIYHVSGRAGESPMKIFYSFFEEEGWGLEIGIGNSLEFLIVWNSFFSTYQRIDHEIRVRVSSHYRIDH